MKKIPGFLPFLTLLFALVSLQSPVQALEEPEILSPYAILVDGRDGKILYEKNAHEKAYPASMTKILTAYLVAEAIDQGQFTLDTMITADEGSRATLASDGSTQGIQVGETMSVRDLLHCLLLASANEAGTILGIAVSGDLESFHELMNQTLQSLGCENTHFVNTHGYHDDEHYTTAYDMTLIYQAAVKNPIVADVIKTVEYTTQATNLTEPRHFFNTNALLSEWYYRGYFYEHAIGGKTGSTSLAGRCLISGAVKEEEYRIAVVMGAEKVEQEDGSFLLMQMKETRDLLVWGIDEFASRSISPGVEPVTVVTVTLSDDADHVMVKAQGELTHTLPLEMDLEEIQQTIHLDALSVEAPVYAGQKLGELEFSHQGEVYGTLDLVAVNAVNRSELLYHKQNIETMVQDSGGTLVAVGVGAGAAVGGLALARTTLKKRNRRNTWRNNQKRQNRR